LQVTIDTRLHVAQRRHAFWTVLNRAARGKGVGMKDSLLEEIRALISALTRENASIAKTMFYLEYTDTMRACEAHDHEIKRGTHATHILVPAQLANDTEDQDAPISVLKYLDTAFKHGYDAGMCWKGEVHVNADDSAGVVANTCHNHTIGTRVLHSLPDFLVVDINHARQLFNRLTLAEGVLSGNFYFPFFVAYFDRKPEHFFSAFLDQKIERWFTVNDMTAMGAALPSAGLPSLQMGSALATLAMFKKGAPLTSL